MNIAQGGGTPSQAEERLEEQFPSVIPFLPPMKEETIQVRRPRRQLILCCGLSA